MTNYKINICLLQYFFLGVVALTGCSSETTIDFEYVTNKFKEQAEKIEKVEYQVHRIDTFASDGTVWNNYGYGLIERDRSDRLFGYSFYGRRKDVPFEYIYDKGIGFKISKEDKNYKIEKGNPGFAGSPGGQMILPHIFYLDSVYKDSELIETKDSYILKYYFEDDTANNSKNVVKTIELDIGNFFPIRVTRDYELVGNKAVHQMELSEVKINDEVTNSIYRFKNSISDYDIIEPTPSKNINLIDSKFPAITLVNLMDENQMVNVQEGKLTLIDFWEVWCGPCLKSFPEIERIKNRYPDELQVVGIVTEAEEDARKLVEMKGATFMNLMGNKEVLNTYGVFSYPRYFLIDKEGIVRKDYFGFSEQVEKDIENMIAKR